MTSRAGAGNDSRELPRRLILLAFGAAVAVIALYLLFVRTSWGQELDEKALLGSGVISDLRADQADRFLRIVSVGTLGLAMVLVAAVAFLRGRPRTALIAAGSIGVAVLGTELLKLVILERPDLTPTTLNGGENSYPSGHTTIGMAVCVAAMLVVPARLRNVTAFGAGAIGAAFGVAVVAAGWHRPSDAAGAYLVCLAAGAAAAALIEAVARREGSEREVPPERPGGGISLGPTELALAGLGAALIGVFGLAALSARGIPFFSAGVGFLLSSGALVVMAFLCTAALASAKKATES